MTSKGALSNVVQPYLVVHRLAKPNGSAVLLISGGYARIELGQESTPAALWLRGQGVLAIELV